MSAVIDDTPARFEHGTSLWQDAWRRLRRNHLAVVGAVVLLVVGLACLLVPWLSPYGYEQQDLVLGAAGPSAGAAPRPSRRAASRSIAFQTWGWVRVAMVSSTIRLHFTGM